MSTFVVGDLVWKLVVDPTPLNRNLAKTATSLKKQEKEMGGILGFLGSKWSVLGGAAMGAAYAMIRASPSLSFAMEEAAYRFQYLFEVIGEQFAPIIEDVLIPALDTIIPLVEQFAPMIGEAVATVIEAFKPLQPVFERIVIIVGDLLGRLFERFSDPKYMDMLSRLVAAIGRIATAILDIAEPALDALFDIFELIEPVLTTVLIVSLEHFATVLELVASFVTGLVAEIKGNEKLMGVFETLSNFISEDLIVIIERLGEWISDLYDWLKDSGLLSIAIKGVTLLFEISVGAIQWVIDKIETLVGWIRDLIGWIDEIDFGKLGEVVGAVADLGGEVIKFIVPGIQTGGYIAQTGLAVVHRGEYVLPAHQTQNFQTQEIIINITFGAVQVSSDYDITRLAENVSREIKRELGMLF